MARDPMTYRATRRSDPEIRKQLWAIQAQIPMAGTHQFDRATRRAMQRRIERRIQIRWDGVVKW
jgi:hypothetical protein